MSAISPGEQSRAELFVRLLAQHERQLNACILALVPNWADAQEIAQETKLRLWRQFEQFDESLDFGAWSRTIARYQVMTYRKQQQRDRLVFSPEFVELVMDEVSSRAAQVDTRQQALAECVSGLSDNNQQLLRRCYSGGTTIREVAQQLGRTVDSTYKALQRIHRRLTDCVEARLEREGR